MQKLTGSEGGEEIRQCAPARVRTSALLRFQGELAIHLAISTFLRTSYKMQTADRVQNSDFRYKMQTAERVQNAD